MYPSLLGWIVIGIIAGWLTGKQCTRGVVLIDTSAVPCPPTQIGVRSQTGTFENSGHPPSPADSIKFGFLKRTASRAR